MTPTNGSLVATIGAGTNGTKPSQANIDIARMSLIGASLRQLAEELMMIFPEREHQIQQAIYALATREHMIVWGTYGTGKSDLVETLLEAITGSTLFSIEMSKFMTEANLFGLPNPKVMKDEGRYLYNPEGTLLEADYAELDEFLDSTPALMRTLLGVLLKRLFKRGRQIVNANLLSAFAATNSDPEVELRKAPELGAVLDRIIFHSNVAYLQKEDSRRRMYHKYLIGERPDTTIPLQDIKDFSAVVVDCCQITDPYFVETYDRVIQAFREAPSIKGQVVISDRRACKLLQLTEANALFYGRYDVLLEDIMAIRWGLCMGGNTEQHEIFRRVAEPIIDKAAAAQQQSVDDVQRKLIQQYEAQLPTIPAPCSVMEAVTIRRQLKALRSDTMAVTPQMKANQDRQKRLIKQIDSTLTAVTKLIDNA